jgi:hypothetical protein
MKRLQTIQGNGEFARNYNELVNAVNGLMQMKGGAGVNVSQNASGIPTFNIDLQAISSRIGKPRQRSIRFGKAILPENRRSIDDCAWFSPGGSENAYCYVYPCDPGGVVHDTTNLTTLTEETVSNFNKVEFPFIAEGMQPNVREGQVIPYISYTTWQEDENQYSNVGDANFYAITGCYQDLKTGSVVDEFLSDTPRGECAGWYQLSSSDTVYEPNTDVATLGASVSLVDVRQTLMVVAGDNPDIEYTDNSVADDEVPNPGTVGTVDVAFEMPDVINVSGWSDFIDVYGSFYNRWIRIN